MTYEDLVKKLIENIPEIKDEYQRIMERTGRDEPLPHLIFGDILNPFILKELDNVTNPELIKRIFIFLEKMAVSNDEKVREVLTDTVLERLGDDKRVLEKARTFMKSNTLRKSHDIEKFWGRE